MSRTSSAAVAACFVFVGQAAAQQAPGEAAFAGKPLAHWVGLLKSDNALLREEAVAVLAEMGPAAKEALPELRPLEAV